MSVFIDGNQLSLEDVSRVAKRKTKVALPDETVSRIRQSRQALEEFIGSKKVYYGINTGFGALASRKINAKDLQRLQKNLIHSHTAGVGDFFIT